MIATGMVDRWVNWSLRTEREPVDRWNVIGLVGLWVLLIAGIVGEHYLGGFYGALVGLIPSLFSGFGALYLCGIPRKLIWARGYRDGRVTWINSLAESHRRGLHPLEWLAGEMERDGMAVRVHYDEITEQPIGLDVVLPHPVPKD